MVAEFQKIDRPDRGVNRICPTGIKRFVFNCLKILDRAMAFLVFLAVPLEWRVDETGTIDEKDRGA